jgi:hypothetical protein
LIEGEEFASRIETMIKFIINKTMGGSETWNWRG